MALIVQKYGGTSVGSPEKIRNVAGRVIEARAGGDQVVVVVSAMAGETDALIELGRSVVERPAGREMDVLLATGEQKAVALLAMALEARGYAAQSFLAPQVRILTDSAFSRARILEIGHEALLSSLRAGRIPVVAGFQGVDREGNLTTLGRGGSDTTAVAVAAAIGADRCDIYTDVDGVYTTDPGICPDARKLARVSYEEMLEMASLGAKVLQTRSVLFAMKYGVPIRVLSSFNQEPGTLVTKEDPSMEGTVVTGITYDRNEARITVEGVPDRPGVAARLFTPIAEAGVNVDMIIQNASRAGVTDLTFTVPQGDLDRTVAVVRKVGQELGAQGVTSDKDVCKVSVIGTGMRAHSGVAAKVFSTLAGEGINILMVSTSEIRISCLIKTRYLELAVRALHAAFDLDKECLQMEDCFAPRKRSAPRKGRAASRRS